MTASLALQQAIVAALAGDAELAARMRGVFDQPPPGAEPPYLTVGPDITTDWSTKTGAGREHRLRVTVWEAPHAIRRCAEAMGRVEAVMAALGPALGGHRLVSLRFLRSAIDHGTGAPADAVAGVVEYRARTQAL
jgi:hypothetical protein